jgi:hypothetical protein
MKNAIQLVVFSLATLTGMVSAGKLNYEYLRRENAVEEVVKRDGIEDEWGKGAFGGVVSSTHLPLTHECGELMGSDRC